MVQNSQETDMCPLCSKQHPPSLVPIYQQSSKMLTYVHRLTASHKAWSREIACSQTLFSQDKCVQSLTEDRHLSLPETKGNHWSQVSHTAPHSRGFSGVFERLRLPGPWLVLSLFPFMCGSCWLHLKATYHLCQLC